MKISTLALNVALLLIYAGTAHSQLKVGDNARLKLNPSASLEIESTTAGFLLPRMTTTQRNAIPLPAKGLQIFNNTTNQIEVNFGTPEQPDWNPTFSSVTGLAITSQDTARWNLNAGWTVRVSASGDTLFLPQGGYILVPGASQLNHPVAPNVVTRPAGRLSTTSVLAAGEIGADGSQPVLQRGFVWGSSSNPRIGAAGYTTTLAGSGTGVFQSTLENLTPTVIYYIRAFAITAVDTAYGAVLSFTIPALQGTVTDIDGNVYKTVQIGPLHWMAENLKTTRFSNGDSLVYVKSREQWSGYNFNCANYDFLSVNDSIFGKLYNFNVAEDNRNICPVGWHVPNVTEFGSLLYSPEADGLNQHLRAIETLGNGGYWFSPNYDVTNRSGFTALPGGYILTGGSCTGKNFEAQFWTKTRNNWGANIVQITNGSGSQPYGGISDIADWGRSIRCVQDY